MKKILVSFGSALFASMLQASYLYWQVDSSDVNATWNNSDYNQAKITYSDGTAGNVYRPFETSGITIYDQDGTSVSSNFAPGGPYVASGTFDNSYTYYIELYNYTEANGYQLVARSGGTLGSEINSTYADTGNITSFLNPGSLQVWHGGGSYTAVPEPTSAMLMLFGAAFLGLKRKNRRIA